MSFEKNAVKAKSIKDFIDTYYKPSRSTGRGEDYYQTLLKSHAADFARHGYDIIDHHSSRTGEVVAYFGTDQYPDRKVITGGQWAVKREAGYTSVIKGDLYILDMDEETGGTILRPVYVHGFALAGIDYSKVDYKTA